MSDVLLAILEMSALGTKRKITDAKVVNGLAFGEEIMRTATEGKISEVAYMWPRPDSDTPVQKVTFVTKAGDQICGVGYYK